jgi:hypothetical protein
MENILFSSLESKKCLLLIDNAPLFSHSEYFFNQESIEDVFEVKQTQKNIKTESDNSSASCVQSAEIGVPLSIFYANSSLQAIVSYLKDFMHLTYSDIARILNRDPRTIWVTYNNAKKNNSLSKTRHDIACDNVDIKEFTRINKEFARVNIPLSIFLSRDLSVLESLVFYLKKDYDLSFNDISGLIGKNYQTVWTVYRRALAKIENA